MKYGILWGKRFSDNIIMFSIRILHQLCAFLLIQRLYISPPPITSARSTVIAAEVVVSVMYYEEPELLPAASGTHTEKGAPPTVGGDEEPVWPWEQPVWPAEVAAAAHLAMGGAISADSGDQTAPS